MALVTAELQRDFSVPSEVPGEYSPAPSLQSSSHTVKLPQGHSLHYYESGAGPDVILIHGALVTADDPIIALNIALASKYRVTAFDRPGHGLSPRPRGPTSLWAQAESIRNAANAIGRTRPILVGQSYGAAVAVAYAINHPDEVAGVVAISPVAFPEPRLEQILFGPRALPFVGEALAATFGPVQDGLLLPLLWEAMFLPRRMQDAFREHFRFDRVRPQRRIQAEGEDALALGPDLMRSVMQYRSCKVPVHVIASDIDIVTNPAVHARQLARHLGNASLTMKHGLGHMLHHFAQDDIVRLVDDLQR